MNTNPVAQPAQNPTAKPKPDLPLYARVSGVRWLVVVAACALAYAQLVLLPIPPGGAIEMWTHAILFPLIPLLALAWAAPVEWKSVIDYTNLRREYGRIMDQGVAVGRELFSGMFDRMPGLRFIHTMFGGNWFANQALLTPHKTNKAEAMQRLDPTGGEKIKQYLDENIFFDMTHPHSWGKEQVEAALRINGADHYMFGSSFPVFYSWMSQGVDFVKNTLDISDADREAILFGNAKKLFNLPV